MRVIEFYARKGGQGTTTVVAGCAIASCHAGSQKVHIQAHDYRDVLAVFGHPSIEGGPLNHLELSPGLTIGDTVPPDTELLVVDAGGSPGMSGLVLYGAHTADVRYLVLRNDYLALARSFDDHPDAVVLVKEPGRALGEDDVRRAVGAPVRVVIDHDPAIARAVDAGLFAVRLPRAFSSRVHSLGRWTGPDAGDVDEAADRIDQAELADIEDHRHAPR